MKHSGGALTLLYTYVKSSNPLMTTEPMRKTNSKAESRLGFGLGQTDHVGFFSILRWRHQKNNRGTQKKKKRNNKFFLQTFITCEQEYGGFWEVEFSGEEELHALGIVEASFELMLGMAIRDATDEGLLGSMGVQRQRDQWRRNRRRRVHIVVAMLVRRWRRRRSYHGDGVAEGASEGLCSRWED
mgnify:CR=1 FL=1